MTTETPSITSNTVSSASGVDRRMPVHAIVFAAVVIACHLPLVWIQLHNLWSYRPHYEFFPLLLAGVGWLMWKRWPRKRPDTPAPTWSSVVLGCGCGLLAIAVLLWAHWVATVALIVSLAGLLGRYWPAGQWRDWVPVWLLLWLIVPPPLGLDFRLITRLQSSTSAMASRVMDLLGILHLMEGNVLVLPGNRMLVDEACSGVNSVLVLLTLTAMYVVAVRRPLIWAAVLLPSSIAWAWAANTVRVTTIAIAQAWFEWDLSTGWQHEVLGYVTISLALAWLISTDYCLSFLLSPIRWKLADLSEFAKQSTPLTDAWNRLVGAGVKRTAHVESTDEPTVDAAEDSSDAPLPTRTSRKSNRHSAYWMTAFGLMGALQFAALALPMLAPSPRVPTDTTAFVPMFAETYLPTSINGWDVVGFEMEERERGAAFGDFSSRWVLRGGGGECIASVDRPFWGWHDLTICYRGTGWELLDRRDVGERGPEDGPGHYVEARFSRPTGEYALLVFGLFEHDGTHLVPPLSGLPSPRLMDRLRRSPLITRLLGRPQRDESNAVYQFQVFAPSTLDVTPEQREELRQLFFAARQQIVRRMNP
jgi:exosortase